ncbi:MAG: 2-oxoglutarate dehydrogenase E1 component [Anaerolineae bacterium]
MNNQFTDINLGYLLDLYERYLADPGSVDAATRAFFQNWTPPVEVNVASTAAAPTAPRQQGQVAPPAPSPSSQVGAGLKPAPTTVTRAPSAAPAPRRRGETEGGRPAPTRPRATPQQKIAPPEELDDEMARRLIHFIELAYQIRSFGHLGAHIDPLGSPPLDDPYLHPDFYHLTEADLRSLDDDIIGGPITRGARNAWEAYQALKSVYMGTTGHEYLQIRVPQERDWLREVVETGQFSPPQQPIDERALLERLTQVDTFERFLHRTFPGKTRFSIEGLDIMVPMLDEIVGAAADEGTRNVIIGMAHRGRLNVLAHNLGKDYAQILTEFQDKSRRPHIVHGDGIDEGWSGDVKYHLGARRAVRGGARVDVTCQMVPNPSHLEYVNPVVEGMARAAQTWADRPGPPVVEYDRALPILIHGDAAFPGQGIVAETLNLHRLPGYSTGGTIHIIANNQLGFTTDPTSGRSTTYASDLAKGFRLPIVHVNADDAVACIVAARLAHAYRTKFEKDFVIDLVGYRRWGHNEGDEPGFTQPVLYDKIANHPTVREILAEDMIRRGVITREESEAMVNQAMDSLRETYEAINATAQETVEEIPTPRRRGYVDTSVRTDRLARLNGELLHLPSSFNLNPKLKRVLDRRAAAFDRSSEGGIDWGQAEALAFASILEDGTPIRLTGQDVERGTFSHRQAVLMDVKTGKPYTPLQNLPTARASFSVYDSPLSESAVVGFEYGYTVQSKDTLVIWEAQYGDFVNSAQVMVDQFVVSGKVKWGQTSGLVMLLPHGFEGQGPEHSSGRLERFLELAAENNLRVSNPTTAAQYFHLMRRQAALLTSDPRPLVVMAPKSLLRHPLAMSPIEDLATGGFHTVLDDPNARPEHVERVVLCSGKAYVDLATSKARQSNDEVALVRVEQLYPFPGTEIRQILDHYPKRRQVVWLQEEPANMGAWPWIRHCIEDILTPGEKLVYIGRRERASPAEGSTAWHVAEQSRIVEAAFDTRDLKELPSVTEVQHAS